MILLLVFKLLSAGEELTSFYFKISSLKHGDPGSRVNWLSGDRAKFNECQIKVNKITNT